VFAVRCKKSILPRKKLSRIVLNRGKESGFGDLRISKKKGELGKKEQQGGVPARNHAAETGRKKPKKKNWAFSGP